MGNSYQGRRVVVGGGLPSMVVWRVPDRKGAAMRERSVGRLDVEVSAGVERGAHRDGGQVVLEEHQRPKLSA
jgi:hypothetical protein